MKYNSLVQLGLIVISITIIFVYIQPTFAEVRQVQDELFEYADAVDKAAEFNQRLGELVAVGNSITAADRARLDRLLPAEVDTVQVMRDLEVLVERTSLSLVALTAEELFIPVAPADYEGSENEFALAYQDFSLEVSGTYEDIKLLFAAVESNDYLLEIMDVTLNESTNAQNVRAVTIDNLDEFSAKITMRVFAQNRVGSNETE